MPTQLSTADARRAALALFGEYRRFAKELKKTADDNPDPNVISLHLTQTNPTFAVQYPIVVRTLATRGIFDEQAFKNYQAYQLQTTVESIARKTPDFDNLEDDVRVNLKLQAQATYNAQYLWLIACENARRTNKRHWRQDVRARDLHRKLIEEERQQLDANEARNREVASELATEKKQERQEVVKHLRTWLQDASKFGDIEQELGRLSTPISRDVASLGSSLDEWCPAGTSRLHDGN